MLCFFFVLMASTSCKVPKFCLTHLTVSLSLNKVHKPVENCQILYAECQHSLDHTRVQSKLDSHRFLYWPKLNSELLSLSPSWSLAHFVIHSMPFYSMASCHYIVTCKCIRHYFIYIFISFYCSAPSVKNDFTLDSAI